MAENLHPFTCDICGVHKGEQNHWFRVWPLRRLETVKVDAVVIGIWDIMRPPVEHFHCCGEEHALRKAGELLGKIGVTNA